MASLIIEESCIIEEAIEPGLPCVLGDLLAVCGCLENLITNAIKYGGIDRRIRISACLQTTKNGKEVAISIQDRGIGIHSSELKHIFEPFYRSPEATLAQIPGTGLGLSVCKHLAEAMGGRLSVKSEVGVGSIFTLHLLAAESQPGELAAMQFDKGTRGRRMNESILLVEDEKALRTTLSDRLRSEGYVVETAADGREGFDKASSHPFDLIILDVMLPRRNGLDVCRDIRAAGMATPILILTVRNETVDKVVGLKLGADDYVTKPFEAAELLARIEVLLRRVPIHSGQGIYQFGRDPRGRAGGSGVTRWKARLSHCARIPTSSLLDGTGGHHGNARGTSPLGMGL